MGESPSPTPSPTGGSTGGSNTKTVSGSFKINGMSYANLNANTTLKTNVVNACKNTLANKANTAASNVAVTLSQGSVAVNYVITVSESAASAVATNLNTATQTGSNSMMNALITAINNIEGINSVVDSALEIADVSQPVMSSYGDDPD